MGLYVVHLDVFHVNAYTGIMHLSVLQVTQVYMFTKTALPTENLFVWTVK